MNQKLIELQQKLATVAMPAVQWYKGREPRERLVLQGLALMLAVLMVFMLIWQPAWSARAKQMQQWQAQARLLQWMQSNEAQIRQRQSNGSKSQAMQGDWISALTRSAAAASVNLKGFNPEGDDAVRIQLENQPFAATFSWLQSLSDLGVQVTSAEFTPGSGTGRVNLRATLRRSL